MVQYNPFEPDYPDGYREDRRSSADYPETDNTEYVETDYTEFIAVPHTEVLVEYSWFRYLTFFVIIPLLICVAIGLIVPVVYWSTKAYNETPSDHRPIQRPKVVAPITPKKNSPGFQENSQRILRGHYRMVNALAISPDSRILISGEGEKQFSPQADIGLDRSIIPDNEALPLTSADLPDFYGLYIWDLAVTRPQRVITEHKYPIMALTFSKTGEYAASADSNGTCILWNVKDWTIFDKFSAADRKTAGLGALQSINSLAFSPNSDFLVAGGTYIPDGKSSHDTLSRQALIILWDIKKKQEKYKNDDLINSEPFYELPATADGVQSLMYTRDGLHIFAALTGSAAGLYVLENNGKVLPVRDINNKIRTSDLYNIPGAAQLPQYSSGHDSPPSTSLKAALRFDDRRIVAGDNHGRVSMWEFHPEMSDPLEMVTCIDYARPYENLDRNIRDLCFSNDGKYLISCGEELAVRNGSSDKLTVLGFLTPEGEGAYRDKPYYAYSLVFTPDNSYLIAGCSDALIRVWDIKTLPAVWRSATTLDIENKNKVFDAGTIEEVNQLEFRPRKKK